MATNLTRYTPATRTGITPLPDMINRLFEESFVLPSVFDRTFRQVTGTNLWETDDAYIVQVVLPGVDAEHVDIQVTGQQLTLKGTYSIPTPENANLIWKGIPDGNFMETMSLPDDVDSLKATAQYDQGLLTVTLPKAEHAKPQSIKVQTAH
ncbi:MAG TPA: Hsp20/alpha crystallin family protein [Chloroflexota bacterium]|nr:Hsp20/alpha crystallin family protein [Chloroflexota bacterium]